MRTVKKAPKRALREALGLILPLFAITLVTAVLLAAVNALTAGRIAENRADAQYGALRTVLPAAARFEKTPAQAEGLDALWAGFDADGKAVGWAAAVTVGGYGGPLSLAVGVAPDLTVAGLAVTASAETPSLGGLASEEAFTGQFPGKRAGLKAVKGGGGENSIDALSGATVTSEAVVKGVELALELCAGLEE